MVEQKALFLETPKGEFRVGQTSIPKPGPGELLVKIHATALNPADWKRHEFNVFVPSYPAIFGIDAAGTVEALGDGVQGFEKGDRVYAIFRVCFDTRLTIIHSAHEGNFFSYDKATFQQYATVPAVITAKVSPFPCLHQKILNNYDF